MKCINFCLRQNSPEDCLFFSNVPVHFPTSMGAVHKPVNFSCVFMLVQLNKCVVCGIVVMGVCHRRFCLNMRVVGHISGFSI